MRWFRFSVVVVLTFVLFGCGAQEEEVTADNVEQAITDEVEKQTGMKPSTDATPCEILDDELLRAHFEIAPDVEILRSPSKYSPHPLCTVSWNKPNAAEIEEQNASKMSERMQAQLRGEEVEALPKARNEVSLTLYEPAFDNSSDAMAAFDRSMERLSKGVTASHEDVEMTFQADLIPVDGVGDKAMWAAKMHQLSVVDDNQIFHVGVNTGAEVEADMQKAKAIAGAVADQL